MGDAHVQSGLDKLALQAELAGAALGCRYSSSDEYEAALIAERRRAGAYVSPFRRSALPYAVMIAVVLLVTLIALQ